MSGFDAAPVGPVGDWHAMLAASGETGARMAAVDWSATPLGPVDAWPRSLRTTVGICLHSPLPIVLWWGRDLVMIYNDACRPLLGASHADALGRPAASALPEAWRIIGPMLGDVLAGRGATGSPDRPLLLERSGRLEECFFTFFHSPVVDDAGVPEGVFTAVTETTDRVVEARRQRTLADLAVTLADAGDPVQVGRRAMRVLARDTDDVAFAELHVPSGGGFTLLDATGGPAVPSIRRWPLEEAAATRTAQESPTGAGPGARPAAVVLPVIGAGGDGVLGLLVLGISRCRPYDRGYRGFLDRLAGHVATALAGLRASGWVRAGELIDVVPDGVDATERARLLRALGEERTRYEQQVSTDILAVFGGVEDRITEANEAFLSMLGYTVEDLRAGSLRLTPLTPPGWETADRRARDDLSRTGRVPALKKEYLHRDGHRVPVLIGVVSLRSSPGRWLAYAADLSAERVAQAELRLFKALVERSGDLIAVADVTGRLRYLNPAGRELTGLGGRTPPTNLIDLVAPSARSDWRKTVSAAVLDAGQHRGETAVLRHDTGAEIDVDQQAFTVAGDATDTRFLAVVARDITDRQRSVHRAEALARFAGALSTAADRADVMAAVTTLSPAVFGARTAACGILSDAHDGLDVVSAGPDGTPVRSILDADSPAGLATAVRTNLPVDTVAGADDPAHPSAPAMVTGCCVPLRYGDGAALGAIAVCWPVPVARDGPANLLDTVAGLTTQALQRAALTASAEAMATLAARLTVTRSPAEAIEVMVSEVPVALGAQLPGLALREADGRVRLYNADLPAELAAAYAELSLDDPRPVVEVLRTGQRIVLPDRAAFRDRYPHLVDHAGAYGMKTTVALPLLDSRGRPVAALGLGWTRRRHFDAADLARLDTVADLCEQTLERTRLVAAEHQLITRLAARLHTGSTTIPDSLDIAVRYRPAMTGLNLGGDWYDLINLAGGRLAVVVGDVVGHHVEAAADMAQVRTLINALIRLGVPLEQVFAQFTALVGREFWGTAVIVVVDPATRRVEIARAGHPHPVLLRPGEPAEQLATHRTAPLGLATGPTVTSTILFEPGDTLITYTDGLIEQRDQFYDDSVAAFHAAAFHTAAGRDAVAAADVADAMLAAAIGADDDQALVVIRHRAPAPGAVADPHLLLHRAFDAETVSDLRRAVSRAARRAGLDDAPLDDFTMAVYELLTNAVRHGGGRGELVLRTAGTDLVCVVADTGGGFTDPARIRTATAPGPVTHGGRGLWLARQLTDGLDITTGPDGVRASLSMRLALRATG